MGRSEKSERLWQRVGSRGLALVLLCLPLGVHGASEGQAGGGQGEAKGSASAQWSGGPHWPVPPPKAKSGVWIRWETGPGISPPKLDGKPMALGWEGRLSPGQEVALEGEGVRLLMVWRPPEGGYVYHQMIEGPCALRVDAEGRPRVEGRGWGHLFRWAGEALSPFTIQWDTINTGFESTEIAVVDALFGPRLVVLDGSVRSEGQRVEAGGWARFEQQLGVERRAPGRARNAARRWGDEAERALLDAEHPCPATHEMQQWGVPLSTEICFEEGGALEDALLLARQDVLGRGQKRGDGWVALAAPYLAAGHAEEAAALYRRALPLGVTDHPGLLRELGNAHWLAGDAEGALDIFRAAAVVAPDAAWGWMGQALTAGHLGLDVEAHKSLERAHTLDPEMPGLQSLLAPSRLANGDIQGALDAATRASAQGESLDPGFLHALDHAVLTGGDRTAQVRVSEVLIQQDPNEAKAWFDLAERLMAAGREEEALDAYERALLMEVELLKSGTGSPTH